MQKRDRERAAAGFAGGGEARARGVFGGGRQRARDFSGGVDSLFDFDRARVQRRRAAGAQIEKFRALLVADEGRIAKTGGDSERGFVAFALEQSVGGDGRSHADFGDARGGDFRAGGEPQQLARDDQTGDAAVGAFGKNLAHDNLAARRNANHIGESAAAIEPKPPFVGGVFLIFLRFHSIGF